MRAESSQAARTSGYLLAIGCALAPDLWPLVGTGMITLNLAERAGEASGVPPAFLVTLGRVPPLDARAPRGGPVS